MANKFIDRGYLLQSLRNFKSVILDATFAGKATTESTFFNHNARITALEQADPPGGTTVIANPEGEATDELNSIQIDSTIYEIVGGSGGGSSNNYSTTEQVIGTWINNKPIYRKTFEVNFHTNGQVWVDTGCVINNIETIVNYSITANDTYVSGAPANVTAALFRYNNSNIQMYVNSAWYLDVHTITVEYTKTTD